MFTLNSEKTRLAFDGEGVEVTQVSDPNSTPGLQPGEIKNLIIHPVQASTMQNGINQYLSNARSLHLLIARDGIQIAQMVDFDHMAVHARDFDRNSLGIGLIYPGYLTDRAGFFYSRNRFDPLSIIFAQSVNDNKKRWYPFYPQAQLDALLDITRLLVENFGIEQILMRQEINKFDLISGPAFPINRLRGLLEGEDQAADLQEETAADVDLFLQPGGAGLKLLDQPVPAATPISVLDMDQGWMLVELLDTLDERRWTVGWLDGDKVKVKDFEPGVSDDHMLITGDNRQIKFIAAHEKNYNANQDLEPRFVVIHFTTGTNIMSTVHTFLNPDNGVSTHLLVGRTGQVVQFVPFDKVAFHCGLSNWEGLRFLNRYAIGIEVDNAGILRKTAAGYTSRGKSIPEDQVAQRAHWKEGGEKAWQTFTDVQIEVVQKIVLALREKYPSIEEIVGHDMINLRNRLDPGPLYPLGELREAVLDDPQPDLKKYESTASAVPIYKNIDFTPPRVVPHPVLGELPKNSWVRVREVYDVWSKVRVKTTTENTLREKEGWILSSSIEVQEEEGVVEDKLKSRTKHDQTFYEVIPAVVPRFPPIQIGELDQGNLVRVQFEPDDRWALVAPVFEVRAKEGDDHQKYEIVIPKESLRKRFTEGWVERVFLTEA